MRVWFIPYGYLDRQRLQSQHFESHGLLTTILKGGRWGTISDQFQRSCQAIWKSHEKAVEEMDLRFAMKSGRNEPRVHSTPMEMADIPLLHRSEHFRITQELQHIDVKQLRNKWEREGYWFGTGTKDLRKAEGLLGIEPGRDQQEAAEVQEACRALVKEHKEFMDQFKGKDTRLGDKLDKLVEHLGHDPLGRRVT